MHKYRFSKIHKDPDVKRLQKETEDNFVSFNEDKNVVIDKDLHCRSLYVDGDSIYIGGIKLKAPIIDEDGYYIKFTNSTKKLEFTSTTTPSIHASAHEVGGADLINHDSLTGFVANEHLPGIDEDDMISDSDVHIPTQQSVKAYVDAEIAGATVDVQDENLIIAMQVFS